MGERESTSKKQIENGLISGIRVVDYLFGIKFSFTNPAYEDLENFVTWESENHTRKSRPNARGVVCRAIYSLDKDPNYEKKSDLAHGLWLSKWQHPRLNIFYMHECGHILVIRIINFKWLFNPFFFSTERTK